MNHSEKLLVGARLKHVLKSNQGDALLLVMVIGALTLLSSVVVIDLANRYFVRQGQLQTNEQVSQKNLNVLIGIAQKFRFFNGRAPTWYPRTYPTAGRIEVSQPSLAVFQPASGTPTGALVPNSIDVLVDVEHDTYRTIHYDLDSTLTSSLQRLADIPVDESGNPTELQKALFASLELDQLSQSEIEHLMISPTSSWPVTAGTFQGNAATLVSFIKYLVDPAYPALVNEVLVSVQPVQIVKDEERNLIIGGPTTATLAAIQLEAPPEPKVQVELVEGQTEPLTPGSQVRIRVLADSIAQGGTLTADGGLTTDAFTVSENQSIGDLGTFKPVAELSLTVPDDPKPGSPSGDDRIWNIEVTLRGVKPQILNTATLSLKVRSLNPPAPVCQLGASPTNVGIGGTTVLTLSCQYAITSAIIAGISVPINSQTGTATLRYTKRTLNSTETITATATGPGGTASATTAIGPGSCRFNDPAHEEYYRAPWEQDFLVSHGPQKVVEYSRSVSNTWLYGGRAGSYPAVLTWRYYYQYGSADFNSNCLGYNHCLSAGWVEEAYYYIPSSPSKSTYQYGFGPRFWATYGPPTSESCTLTYVAGRQSGCFREGTKVRLADGKEIPVENLRPGDWLRAAISGNAVRVNKLVAGPESKPLWKISFSGRSVEVTADHPFLTRRGILPAEKLKISDEVKTDGGWRKIDRVTEGASPVAVNVWNFELDTRSLEDHFIWANGVPSGDLVVQEALKARNLSLP